MLPIQLIILLVLVSTPAILAGDHPAPAPDISAWQMVLLFGGFVASHLGVALFAGLRTGRAMQALHQPVADASVISSGIDSLLNRGRWSTLALTGFFLFCTPVPGLLEAWHQQTRLLKYLQFIPELLLIVPAMLAWVGFWICSYYAECASRERSLPFRLSHHLPAHEMPSLAQYLSMQCRHNFFILVPILVDAGIMAIGGFLARWIPGADTAAVPVSIVAVLLLAPWLLVRIWQTVPLTGELRARLDRLAAAYRLRFRNILLWKTHNAITNAAILGWVPFARYFLMTDALLESLSDRQLEAVFAHEVGHGVHRHILWYLVYFAGCLTLATGIGIFWVLLMPAPLGSFAGQADATVYVLSTVLFGLLMMVGFPGVSRRFENQADWFASKHMAKELTSSPATETPPLPETSSAGPAVSLSGIPTFTLAQFMAAEHPATPSPVVSDGPGTPSPAGPPVAAGAPAAGAAALTPFTPLQGGAEVFISALSSIVEIGHRSRDKKDWMHPSVNDRIALLRALAAKPEAVTRFERQMRWTRVAVALLLIVGLGTGTAATFLDNKYHPAPANAFPLPAQHGPHSAGTPLVQ
jgi:STE24 endopeptidase